MKTNKSFYTLLTLVVFTTALYAQSGKFSTPSHNEAVELKDRQPIMVLNSLSPNLIKEFNKNEDEQSIDLYTKTNDEFNDNLKASAKFWTFNSKPVLFKTREEVRELLKNGSDKYVLIYCCNWMEFNRELSWNINANANVVSGSFPEFGISTDLKRIPIYGATLDMLIPEEADFAYYLLRESYIFKYEAGSQKSVDLKDMVNENKHILSQKTLLISSACVNEDMEDNLKANYPFKYQVVSQSDLEDSVLALAPSCAYLYTTGFADIANHSYMCWVVNCSDGAILAYSDATKTSAEMNDLMATFKLNNNVLKDIAKFGTKK